MRMIELNEIMLDSIAVGPAVSAMGIIGPRAITAYLASIYVGLSNGSVL